jgi:hypothetical protein
MKGIYSKIHLFFIVFFKKLFTHLVVLSPPLNRGGDTLQGKGQGKYKEVPVFSGENYLKIQFSC